MIGPSQWFLKWLLPIIASALVGGLLLGTLYWAAARADQVAAARQKDLPSLRPAAASHTPSAGAFL
jgi:hypothetical protein